MMKLDHVEFDTAVRLPGNGGGMTAAFHAGKDGVEIRVEVIDSVPWVVITRGDAERLVPQSRATSAVRSKPAAAAKKAVKEAPAA